MKNQIMIAAIFLFFISPIAAQASEPDKKIRVTPNQIVITNEMILAYVQSSQKPIVGKTLSFDEEGLYIKEWKGPCWLHDLWCEKCGGCGVLFVL